MPKYVSLVAQKVAEVLGEDVESVIERTSANTKRLFYKIVD